MKKNFLLTMVLALLAFFTVQTTNAQAPVATPQEAITGLLNRIGGNGAADKFAIVIDANLAENGKDVFVITSQDGKPCIKGNTQLSVATGINWYLNHYAHINLTWNNLTTDLSAMKLPVPTQDEKHVCNTTYRYDFNTCTFSYSMAFWTWERWQQEIDWMALHGINAPLNLVGLEVVTRNFLRELGVSENDINAYIAGPGFMAWFAMNNLEGWGSTINSSSTGVQMNGNPDWWYTRQEQLCRNMMQRMRELGMQPVIPGFSGQVPKCLTGYTTIEGFSGGDVVTVGSWASNFPHPGVVNPSTNSYKNLADVYYKHLHDVMGISEFYSIDPFHEMSAPVAANVLYPNIMSHLDRCYALETAEERAKFNAPELPKWIIQYWQGTPVTGAFTAMKNAGYTNRFIALDLFADNIYADNAAKWRTTYYDTCPYIYCMLHNFGGRSGMHGRLQTTMDGYFQALAKNNNCQGIGATPEGTETNPVLYDMLFELPWMDPNNRPTADEWLKDYAYSRYGVKNDIALEALKNLKKSVWDCKVNQQGTSEAIILARPNWTVNSVSFWSTSAIYWDTQDVRLAADQLISIANLVTTEDGIANYNYDVIDAIRQAMVDYAAELLPLINAARGNTAEYTRLYQLYLQLMLDLDTMLSYDEGFKLERWTSLARNIADEVTGTTENDRNWLEWNARTQVTVWANQDCALHDYSNRCWAGLIKDFHYKRWEKFFTTNGGSFDGGWYRGFEYPWTVDFNNTYNLASDYSQVVIPNDMTATEKAVETFGKYFGRVKGATKNYIFPMGVVTTATNSDVIPEVYRGKEVELPLIIGKEVTVSSVWIDLNNDGNAGNAETLTANGNKVTIPADAAIGKTTAKVTYSDGTVITFNIALIEDITEARTVTAVAGDNGSVAIEGTDELSITTTGAVKITATANTGYNFENWTKDGEVVSNDNPFVYYGKEEATFTANFVENKWGVVVCGDDVDGQGVVKDEAAVMNDISNNKQYIKNLTFAYYNRDAETIFEGETAPTAIFTTIPGIINVPQGASFTVEYDSEGDGFKHCYFRAFIDLNADGDFDDEGELLTAVGTAGAQNTAVCSSTIKVILPYNIPLGMTHMRLRFDSAWNIGDGAKDPSVRPVYEMIINVTEGSNKAAHIEVESNNESWGTVECWTDETPTSETFKEFDVSSNILMHIKATPASEDVEFLGWYDHHGRLFTNELQYSRLAIEDAVYTARFRKMLEIGDWQIEYNLQDGGVVLSKVLKIGEGDLVIPQTVTILGEELNIVGFESGLFENNKELTSITLPATMVSLGSNVVFSTSVEGENTPTSSGDTNPDAILSVIDLNGLVLKNNETWEIRASYKSDGKSTYNEWGSPLLYPNNTGTGNELFYLSSTNKWSTCWHVRSPFSGLGNDYFKEHTDTKISTFIAALENKGTGKAVITITNSLGEPMTSNEFTFSNDNISAFSAKLPKGLDITNFEIIKGDVYNPFTGCSNLDAITIDGTCENFYINEDGDLYNSADELVCSPAGKEKGADRRLLGELIEKMDALTAKVATYNPTGKETEIVMTTTADQPYYIWCSNPHTGDNNDARGGVAALLDENDDTYLHSNYTNVSSSNDYLQVENNELYEFKIGGKQRKGAGNDLPKTIEVQGSNDKIKWETITTVNDIPQNAGAAWKSGVISTTTVYPYLRFVVTTGTNRKYFHMAKFDLYKLSATADVNTLYEIGVTDDQAATAYDALLAAIRVYDNGTTATEMQAAKEELQEAYDTLKELVDNCFPFTLTTDEEKPVLYKIFIERTPNTTVLQYDATTTKVAVANKADNNSWQAWYFVLGTNGFLMKPYNTDGYVLGTDDTGNGAGKVLAAAAGKQTYYEWCVRKQGDDGCYNIYINDENGNKKYFSNFGGPSNKMGFWNGDGNESNTQGDSGSKFKFVEAEFTDDNARYYQLSDVKVEMSASNLVTGTNPGCYSGVEEYNAALEAATQLVNAGSAESASEDCYAAYQALRATKAAIEMIMPVDGKIYRIKNLITNTAEEDNKIHYISSGENTFVKVADNTTLWMCIKEGETYKFVSAGNATIALGWKTIGSTAQAYTITSGVEPGAVSLANGTINLALTNEAHSAGLAFNHASSNGKTQSENWSTDWYLEDIYPFTLTTDEENPVLYKIIINRDFNNPNATVLKYNESTGVVNVVADVANSSWQAWYFMQGDNGGILIKPYNGDGKVLGADDNNNGGTKVWSVEKDSKAIDEWTIEKNGEWYNILGDGHCFSNHGGSNSGTMGFYNDKGDGGSQFKFVPATFDNNNPRYYQLVDVAEAMSGATYFTGESVGLYSTNGVEALNAKLTEAGALSNASSSDDCYAMYKALRAAKKDAYNAPAADKVYYIVSTATGDDRAYCTGKYVHTYSKPHLHKNASWGDKTYDQKHLLFDAKTDISQLSLAAFQFEETGTVGEYKMKNLHTGLYVKSFEKNAELMGDSASAQHVRIYGIADGQVALKIGNNSPMHAQKDYSVIVSWTAEPNNPSTWTINEVADLSEIYKLIVPESGDTTLNLAFNVQLPEGVTAYDFVEGDIALNGERNEFTLTEVAVAGDVLAKNTPVVIKAAAGEYNLTAVLSDENVVNGTAGSVLRGNYWQTTVGTAEVNYLPAIDENKLVFNKVAADDTAVTANTVWAVLNQDKGATIYEYIAPEPLTMPEVGKVYRIKNYTVNTPDEYKYHYIVNSNLNIAFPTSVEDGDKGAMWVCTAADDDTHKYQFVSALGTAAFGWQGVSENALEYTISEGTIAGTVTLSNDNKNLALTTEAWNNRGAAAFNQARDNKTQADNWSTDWYIEEVKNADVKFSKLIPSGNSFATMYLPYDVEIPAGVYAYYAGEIVDSQTGTKKVIDLRSVDAVIPKNTAVLLYRENKADSETFDFALSTGDAEAIVGNLFEGNVMTSAVEAPNGFRVFLLLNYNEKEAFYWMAPEYNDSLQAGESHVKCDANKAYLKIDVTTMGKASSYSFRYDGTTGIEDIEDVDNVESGDIYDLQGRKVTKPVKGGIYIKNGVKVIM